MVVSCCLDFEKLLSDQNLAIADAAGNAARELGVTPSQVALSWIISRGIIPFAGATRVEQMKDNLASVYLRLRDAVIDELDTARAFEPSHPYSMLQWDNRPGWSTDNTSPSQLSSDR
jgi:aryl-alcohol dehydrogenase-like predicted oxidoreductase